jgi:hypothetical protein
MVMQAGGQHTQYVKNTRTDPLAREFATRVSMEKNRTSFEKPVLTFSPPDRPK